MAKRIQKKISRSRPLRTPSRPHFKPLYLLFLVIPLLLWFGYRLLVQPSEINLIASTSPIPANCTSWFDGCNTCQVSRGALAGCTKKACKTDTTEPARCLSFTGGTPAPSVAGDVSEPVPSFAPVATALPVGCYMTMPPCPAGRMCAQVMQTICPSPTPPLPTSTPQASLAPGGVGTLVSFTASTSCGPNSFSLYIFACRQNNVRNQLSGCLAITDAYQKAIQECKSGV